jgi:signal transduction histidine kinase
MRHLLGRAGWPVAFFLVSGLIFAGLGWVTYSALRVEQAQREAAARAELGNNLRETLWRLDGRMLLVLGAEDSRPFYHYDTPDPVAAFAPAAPPLLSATLPDWMQLHFQLDPAKGWMSCQVPADPVEIQRLQDNWDNLPNFYGGREIVLDDMKRKFPARKTCELFAARDRDIPADSLPFAAPLFTEVNSTPRGAAEPDAVSRPPESMPKPPPPADPVTAKEPNSSPDTVSILGIELCLRSLELFPGHRAQTTQQQDGSQLAINNVQNDAFTSQKKANEQRGNDSRQTQKPPTPTNTVVMRGGTRLQMDAEAERGWVDYLKRAQIFGKGLEEAKNAYGDSQLSRGPASNYAQTLPQQNNDSRPLNTTLPLQTTSPVSGVKDEHSPKSASVPGGTGMPTAPAMPGPGAISPPAAVPTGEASTSLPEKQNKEQDSHRDRSRAAGGVVGGLGTEALRAARRENEPLPNPENTGEPAKKLSARSDAGTGKDSAPPTDSGPSPLPGISVPPGEDRPVRPTNPTPPDDDAPHAVHLGSMRPQWVTSPDGSEVLMLVRAARLEFRNPAENKTVYQGIIIDWPKLEAKLKDEVKDLFPEAKLLPVKDPDGVSPGRAMTALPVQLDIGPEPPLPPAGWTPLRIGIVLAWAATLIAVVAVGFSGWSLVDLAERRIRFVSAVTHELRTPLTSLRLYLDLLVSGMVQDEAKRQEYLNTLATESDRLHRLIDNVLDFARLEKRRKDGDIKPVKVRELVEQLRATWADRVERDGKELVLVSTLPPEREVATDAAMIQQIVGNLIDNARKYTRDAEDKRIWLWAKPGQGKSVVLEVEDRGPGVPVGERRGIFKPFRRGEQADTRAGGAGLGLALAKSWAEVLGARLSYRPAEGGTGACFRLELPGG